MANSASTNGIGPERCALVVKVLCSVSCPSSSLPNKDDGSGHWNSVSTRLVLWAFMLLPQFLSRHDTTGDDVDVDLWSFLRGWQKHEGSMKAKFATISYKNLDKA